MDELPTHFSSPGQRLGRYELLGRLAVGGMAELYLARADGRADFQKLVAIKKLLPHHALDPQIVRMFLDEARLMARLSHPNVPQVYDVGGEADAPFFVMELVAGPDLREIMNASSGPLPIEHAVAIASAVAAGLHHAHELRGDDGGPLEIVHRDVSPSNVLVSSDGGVKVTDFGVAKWAGQRSRTHHGQLKGKFAHMSPEQCRGEPLDRRSDVFALGTLLYEMIGGVAAFTAASEYELLRLIVSTDPPPLDRPGGLSPALAEIVMRALRRERDERYATAEAMLLDLDAFARGERLATSPVALARYLGTLFGARVFEWERPLETAEAQGRKSLRARAPTVVGAGRDRTATDLFSIGDAPTRPLPHEPSSPGTGWRPRRLAIAGVALAASMVVAAVWLGGGRRFTTGPVLIEPAHGAAIGVESGAKTDVKTAVTSGAKTATKTEAKTEANAAATTGTTAGTAAGATTAVVAGAASGAATGATAAPNTPPTQTQTPTPTPIVPTAASPSFAPATAMPGTAVVPAAVVVSGVRMPAPSGMPAAFQVPPASPAVAARDRGAADGPRAQRGRAVRPARRTVAATPNAASSAAAASPGAEARPEPPATARPAPIKIRDPDSPVPP